jgi:hypothetical protein
MTDSPHPNLLPQGEGIVFLSFLSYDPRYAVGFGEARALAKEDGRGLR